MMNGDEVSRCILQSVQGLISAALLFAYRNVECEVPLHEWLTVLCIVTTFDTCASLAAKIFPDRLFPNAPTIATAQALSWWLCTLLCVLGKAMTLQCKECQDEQNSIYAFGYWCSWMAHSVFLYQIRPELASVSLLIGMIVMSPILVLVELMGIGVTSNLLEWMLELHPDDEPEWQCKASAARARAQHLLQLTLQTLTKAEADQQPIKSCSICLDAYSEHDTLRVLACKHQFHSECVDPWILNKNHCPMCRRTVLRCA